MAVVSDRMAPEIVQPFWAAPQSGEFITEAAERAGTYRKKGALWLVAAGGVSKPALSAHFRSKSELVAAVLERRHTRRTESLQAWVSARTDDPRQRFVGGLRLARRLLRRGGQARVRVPQRRRRNPGSG